MASPRILIAGGGFAGVAALQALRGRGRVTLVDERPSFEFLPNIHELLSGVKTPRNLRLPLEELARGAGGRFHRARVERIDAGERRVVLSDGSVHGYDALVLALGGVNADRGVVGVVEHAWPFKSVDQVAALAARLGELDRPAGGQSPVPVVVVGGGLEGVEALGEILRRDPRGLAFAPTLVEAGPRLLPDAPQAVARSVLRHAARHGVEVYTGAPVQEVREHAVLLGDGRELPSRCTIWTGGPAPSPVPAASGLADEGAWVSARPTLQHPEHPEIFVAGDLARLSPPLAQQAYHALDAGVGAAQGVLQLLGGGRPRVFRPQEKPTLLAFGSLDTYLVWGRFAVASPALAAAKEAIFESVMARLDGRHAPTRASAAAGRWLQAAERLTWPALSSLPAIQRSLRFAWLSPRDGA